MTRRNAIIRICIWSVVALTLIGTMAVAMMTEPSLSFFNGQWSLGITGTTYLNAAQYSVGNAEISEDIQHLDIHWTSGSVSIILYDGDTVRITEEDAPEDTDLQVHWLVKNGKLTVQYSASRWFFGAVNFGSKNLTIEIPGSMAAELLSLDIETVSASVALHEIGAKEISIETVSGSLRADRLTTSALSISTTSGNISATDLNVRMLDVENVSGAVSLAGVIGGADIETVSGEVELSSSTTFTALDMETVSGDITLNCPMGEGFTVEMDTVSGDLNCKQSANIRGNNYTYGDGKHDYSFDSVSGDLFLHLS